MRKLPVIGFLAALATVVATGPAGAGTSTAVRMTLTEPLLAGRPGPEPCPDIGVDVDCGSGEVIPFRHATHIVSIGACGETCNFRPHRPAAGIDLPHRDGRRLLLPRSLRTAVPASGAVLTGAVRRGRGGTGSFGGATGSLAGTVKGAGWHAQIKLAVALLSALAPLMGADASPTTLVKGTRVSIESRGNDPAPRTFTLTYLSRVDRSPDIGSSVRVVEKRRVDVLSSGVRRREASGTEVFEGGQGTLTLGWSTEQIQRKGGWGDISGCWFVTGSTGVYFGLRGHGELSADRRFRTTTYRGLLMTAV
jgi:hypothetical protein